MGSRSLPVNSYTRLLEAMLEGHTTLQFTTSDDLERTMEGFRPKKNQSDCLVVKEIPFEIFLELAGKRASILFHSRSLYLHNSHTLRVTMPNSRAHDAAIGRFCQMMQRKWTDMGVGPDEIHEEHSGILRMGNVSKMPDGCWIPAGRDYMTTILEVGYSETIQELARDARLWLESPESDDCHCHQVIIIKTTPDHPEIIFQIWETSRREYGMTRSTHPRRARKTQEVKVLLEDNIPTASGSLSVSFSKLFERPPRPETSEGNIIFTPEDLTNLARGVWRRQNLIPREMASGDTGN